MSALSKIKFEAKLSHFDDSKEWPRYVFNCFINKEKFEYSMGIGHAKNGKCKVPKLEDVLNSLMSDFSLSIDSFENFCSSMSYDTDSRNALKIYLECQQNGSRLKKSLGSDFDSVKEEIEKLEL